jgi:hypothetical protein
MTTTGGLTLPTISESQTQKFQTHNDALQQVDTALTASLAVALAGASVTLTAAQVRTCQFLALSGASAAGITVTLPAVNRMLVIGLDAASSNAVTVALGGASFTLAVGDTVICFANGPAPGLVMLSSAEFVSAGGYTLPAATTAALGGVIASTGLAVDGAGHLTASLGDGLGADGGGHLVVTFGTVAGTAAQGNDARLPPAPGAGVAYEVPRVNAAGTALEYVVRPYEAGMPIAGKPAAGETASYAMTSPVVFAASLAGWRYTGSTPPTGAVVVTVRLNGASIGTMTVAAGATTATFAGAGGSFAAGDVLQIAFPAIQDATWADFGISLYGERR